MSFYLFRKSIRRLPGQVIKAVPLPEPVITSGFGKRAEAGAICREKGYKSVLLVTDETLFSLGYHEKVVQSIEKEGIECSVFHNISGEPSVDIVLGGRKAAAGCGAECIVALGGGSVMDSSKIIAASVKHSRRKISHYLQKFVFENTLPMITIPSTAGTGAEETVGAVIKNRSGRKKASVIVGLNVTDVILDSELTMNAPGRITACCGIDALSHGLEGCLSDVKVSEEDMHKSCECVRLIFENLPDVLSNPSDTEKRQNLCLAANYGGNAINKQLAGYVHAFAHTIGAFYHISHGEAIARCIVPVVDYGRKICGEQLKMLSVYCGFSDENAEEDAAAEAFIIKLKELLKVCGFDGGCDSLDEKDYNKLVRGINADSINYSPAKTLTDREIKLILDRIRRGIK